MFHRLRLCLRAQPETLRDCQLAISPFSFFLDTIATSNVRQQVAKDGRGKVLVLGICPSSISTSISWICWIYMSAAQCSEILEIYLFFLFFITCSLAGLIYVSSAKGCHVSIRWKLFNLAFLVFGSLVLEFVEFQNL